MPEETTREKHERGMRLIDEALETMDPTPVVQRIMTVLREHDMGTFTLQDSDSMLLITVDANITNAIDAFMDEEYGRDA